MRVLHLISGGDTGGGKSHVINLVEQLRRHMEVLVGCFVPGAFYQEVRRRQIPAVLFAQRGRWDLRVLTQLVRLVRDRGYQLVHSHGPRANFLVGLARGALQVPCVTTIHSDWRLDFEGSTYKKLVYTRLNALALRRFDFFVTVSEEFARMLEARGYPRDRIFALYNGLDFEAPLEVQEREKFLRNFGVESTGVRTVGAMGRLHPVKGHDVFLRAAAAVAREYPEPVRFLVAGEGPQLPALIRLARELGIANRVHFLGHVESPFDFLNAVEVNVLASRSESFPYALLEGARLRKPTVATAVGGIPELVEHEKTGLLVAPGAHEEMAKAILKLLSDSDLAQRLGHALWSRARERFSARSMAEDQIRIYREIMDRCGAREGRRG